MKELGSVDSLNTTGQVPLTGDFSLMQLYLPFIVVVLAIVALSIDSLNTTGQKPLTGDFSLTRLSLYYVSTVEGSLRGRSDIWQFQGSGFPPNGYYSIHGQNNTNTTLVIGQTATPQSPIRPY
jgi:hypothetical protein